MTKPLTLDDLARADARICSIDGCGKVHKARGWCAAHYKRWRQRGSPLGGSTCKGAPLAFLENTVFSFCGDDCLVWPFGRGGKGYGKIAIDGKTRNVHRIVCEHEHGPPPTPGHEAAHNCGKGHEGCVNRKHLEWKTRAENEADKLLHGTHSWGERCSLAKLTEAQVIEIRGSVISPKELAAEYGVSHYTIADIRARKSWAWLEDAAMQSVSPQIEGE